VHSYSTERLYGTNPSPKAKPDAQQIQEKMIDNRTNHPSSKRPLCIEKNVEIIADDIQLSEQSKSKSHNCDILHTKQSDKVLIKPIDLSKVEEDKRDVDKTGNDLCESKVMANDTKNSSAKESTKVSLLLEEELSALNEQPKPTGVWGYIISR